jgi:poly(3-hydroxybutyrate) depolymerase
MQRAIAHRNAHHTYGFNPKLKLYQIHEPADADGGLVLTLHGDPMHDATHMQADAICKALDRLMKARA